MIKKFYADLAQGQTHYRRAGQGNPVVVLHPSPMSSSMMLPIINTLVPVCDVIAPDTPGYGQSDSLSQDVLAQSDDLSPYVAWLLEFFDVMELEKVCLYGSATGAQIAIEFARAYPQRLSSLVLENVADFSEEECQDALKHYFPSIAPKADGSHLIDVWGIAQSLSRWFPWYAQDDEHKVSDVVLPPSIVHATTMAYLQAGEGYAEAYRRAFLNEKAERVITLTVPTTIIRSDASIVKAYTDRFDTYSWPEHIKMRFCGADISDRYAAIKELVTSTAASDREP